MIKRVEVWQWGRFPPPVVRVPGAVVHGYTTWGCCWLTLTQPHTLCSGGYSAADNYTMMIWSIECVFRDGDTLHDDKLLVSLPTEDQEGCGTQVWNSSCYPELHKHPPTPPHPPSWRGLWSCLSRMRWSSPDWSRTSTPACRALDRSSVLERTAWGTGGVCCCHGYLHICLTTLFCMHVPYEVYCFIMLIVISKFPLGFQSLKLDIVHCVRFRWKRCIGRNWV